MDKGSLAAAELMVFLGLVGWLLYYQFSASKRDSDSSEGVSKEEGKDGNSKM